MANNAYIEPPLIVEPLTVDVVGEEIVLDGVPGLDVVLSQDAALETGIKLVNAAVGLDADTSKH